MLDVKSIADSKIKNIKKNINNLDFLSAFFLTKIKPKNQKESWQQSNKTNI